MTVDTTTRQDCSPTVPSQEMPPRAQEVLKLSRHLNEQENQRLMQVREHLQQHVRRQSIQPWNEERLPLEMLQPLNELGLGELILDGASPLLQGLIHAEIARADISLSALVGIHNELIVGTIDALGSEKQKQHWLPRLRRFESLGAFCLTEPEHGSDIAGGLETTAVRQGDKWTINGSKRWIGAGTVADVAVVWARDTNDNEIKCFLMPTDTPGYDAQKIANKTGLRIMQNADITFNNVELPLDALLPGATSFAAAGELLKASRAWVGWQSVGAQQALLDVTQGYTQQRKQFGVPLAKLQLIQAALAKIAGNLGASGALMADLASHDVEGTLDMTLASLAKATTTRLARESAADAREALGGNGLVSEYEIAKIAGDIEALYTYEGSHNINLLIVGRGLTGVSAFV